MSRRRKVLTTPPVQLPKIPNEYDVAVPSLPSWSSSLPINLPEVMSEEFMQQLLNRTQRCLRDWHRKRIGPPRVTFQQLYVYRRSSFLEWMAKNESKPVRQKGNF